MTELACLLVVGRRFKKEADVWMSEGANGVETGERYLHFFNKLTIVGRQSKKATLESKDLSQVDSRIDVCTTANLSDPLDFFLKANTVRQSLLPLIKATDAVIIRLGNPIAFTASVIAHELGKPLACDVGGRAFDSMQNYGSLISWLYAPFAEIQARNAVRRCNYVSYVTQEYLQSCYPVAEGARTFSGSNVDIPTPKQETLVKRKQRQAVTHDRELVFGTIGSLNGRLKGIHTAIRALAKVHRDLPPWRYRILGWGDPGPYRQLATTLGIDEYISFDGVLPSGEPVLSWLSEVDVYVHPSLREGLPRAVIEAMSCACPTIATSVAGTPELLEKEDLVAPGDSDELASALKRSLSQIWQLERAERNWRVSFNYSRNILDPKRNAFWSEFANFAAAKKTIK